MARISGATLSEKGFFARQLIKFAYWRTKRRVGKVVMPVQIVANHPKLLWGYGMMEQTLMGSRLVDTAIKNLVQLRAATLIGCPF